MSFKLNSFFNLTETQINKIEEFHKQIIFWNERINLISRKDIDNFILNHVVHSLSISCFFNFNDNTSILDLGTGGGLPGIPLSILGYQNVFMIDSVGKKIDFIRDIIKKISLSAKTEKKRIENLNIGKADMIVSRALAPLNKLLSYSLFLSNKNTTCLFLKGRSVYNEIEMARKNFFFNYETFKSISSEEGHVLKITNLNAKKR